MPTHTPVEEFRAQSRDLYIPPGDVGMWQGALRNPNDPVRAQIAQAIDTREPITIELSYSDLVGGQRTITRLGLTPLEDSWIATIVRHWYLDWSGPRPERDLDAAASAVRRDREEAEKERAAAAAGADATAGQEGVIDGPAVSDDDPGQELPVPGRIEETA
jgi:hypothetical protein